VLFPDSTQQENSLGLIIYDQNIINAIDNRYDNDRKNGIILKINENDDDRTIKNTIINWIKESNKRFNDPI
jgi:nitrous oxidase accessory protein NosD